MKRMDTQLAVGTRIVLDSMKDPAPLTSGSQGTFEGYEKVTGGLIIAWDCGSQLKLIEGVDEWHVISSDEEIEASIAHEKDLQDAIDINDSFTCPRCGKEAVKRFRALSRLADISVCEGCGTMEAIIEARKGGVDIKVTGANEATTRDFKRVTVRDWKMVRVWQGLEDIQ